MFKYFARRVQNEKEYFITSLRSDHGKEFENEFEIFCSKRGISDNFHVQELLNKMVL